MPRHMLLVVLCLQSWLLHAAPAEPGAGADFQRPDWHLATPDTARVRLLLRSAQVTADPDQAHRYARQALALIRQAKLPQLLPKAYTVLGSQLQRQRKLEQARRCFVLARTYSQRLHQLVPLAESYRLLGILEAEQNRPAKALPFFQRALALHLQMADALGTLQGYNNVGFCLQQQGLYAPAMQAYLAGLKIGEQQSEARLAGQYVTLLSNLGALYGTQYEHQTAIRYLQRARGVLRRFPDPAAEITVLAVLGSCYYNTQQDALALRYLSHVLRLSRQQGATAPSRTLASTLYYLGSIAQRRKASAQAMNYLQRAADQAAQTGNNDLRVFALNAMADVYGQQRQFTRAGTVARQALRIARQAGYAHPTATCYATLARISAAAGDFAAAYRYQNQFQNLNDSLFSEAKSKALADLATRYRLQQKETQISLLQRNTALQHRSRNLLAGVLFAVALMGAGTYRRYHLERRARRLLQAKEEELAARNQVLVETEHQLQCSLEEKEVLLKEVHHRVKNNLQVIASRLALQAMEPRTHPAVTAALRDGQSWVKSIALIHEMLYQSEDLASVEFQPFLEQLVGQLARTFAGGGAERVTCTVQAAGVRLGPGTAVPLGLIINELLSNAYKHAFGPERTGTIQVLLTSEAHGYRLRVRDDGVGLPAGFSLDTTASLGLRLVRSLARQLEGHLVAQSRPGASSEFSLTFQPLDEPELFAG